MGVRNASLAAVPSGSTTLTTTTETALVTVGPINLAVDAAQVLLFWFLTISTGASTMTVKVFIHRGSGLGGAFIGNGTSWVATTAASSGYTISGCYVDNPGVGAELQWTLSAQQVGASGNGTVSDASLIAMVL